MLEILIQRRVSLQELDFLTWSRESSQNVQNSFSKNNSGLLLPMSQEINTESQRNEQAQTKMAGIVQIFSDILLHRQLYILQIFFSQWPRWTKMVGIVQIFSDIFQDILPTDSQIFSRYFSLSGPDGQKWWNCIDSLRYSPDILPHRQLDILQILFSQRPRY